MYHTCRFFAVCSVSAPRIQGTRTRRNGSATLENGRAKSDRRRPVGLLDRYGNGAPQTRTWMEAMRVDGQALSYNFDEPSLASRALGLQLYTPLMLSKDNGNKGDDDPRYDLTAECDIAGSQHGRSCRWRSLLDMLDFGTLTFGWDWLYTNRTEDGHAAAVDVSYHGGRARQRLGAWGRANYHESGRHIRFRGKRRAAVQRVYCGVFRGRVQDTRAEVRQERGGGCGAGQRPAGRCGVGLMRPGSVCIAV